MDFQTAFSMVWEANSTLLVGCVISSALFFSLANRQALMRKIMHTIGFVGLGIVLEYGRLGLFDSIGETYTSLPATYTISLLLAFAVGDWLSYLVHIVHIKFAGGRLWIELAKLLGKLAIRFEATGVHYMPAPERAIYLKSREKNKATAEHKEETTTEENPVVEEETAIRKTIVVNDRTKKEVSIDENTKPVNVIFTYSPDKSAPGL